MLANTDLFRGKDKQKTSDIFVMDFPLLFYSMLTIPVWKWSKT